MTSKKKLGTIAIGSDHAGYPAKERIKTWLRLRDYSVQDFGADSEESVNYPDYAKFVARAVLSDTATRGILICGTGLGMSYAANRFPGIRAALCWSEEAATLAREHNNANILVLPGRIGTMDPLEDILIAWLDTGFTAVERHQSRITLIDET